MVVGLVGLSSLIALLVGGSEVWWGPDLWAPPTQARGRSRGRRQVRGNHRPRCAPGPHAPVRAAPGGAALLQHLFPVLRQGGPQLCPLTAASPLDWWPRGFIVSGAVLCMGGPLLTVCASWLLPAGHGSHGPTMYHSPSRARPPAGGPVQEKPGKKNKPPGWWSSRKVWNPWGSVKLVALTGAPRFYRIHLAGRHSCALLHQQGQSTTGARPCQCQEFPSFFCGGRFTGFPMALSTSQRVL